MIVPSAEQIRQRLEKRRAPQIGQCASCGHKQEAAPWWQTIASSMATEQNICQKCRGQIVYTITIGGDEPSADEDLQTLLTLLDTLSQELERLKHENTELLSRVDSQRLSETTGSTASTERR